MENGGKTNPYSIMSPRAVYCGGQQDDAATSAAASAIESGLERMPCMALARREASNQLVSTNRSVPAQADQLDKFGENSLTILQRNTANMDENDSIDVLEEKAQWAKRKLQAERKQIPPFVQKLNSILESSKNTDLIRWSKEGDSFIVLDEDGFSKTLIPELYKHNNYTSFVRQLNMYGFHKKVGLLDNSMMASERKNKSPSEYYHPYFRRGHPILLWMIKKPKSGNPGRNSVRRADEGNDENGDDVILGKPVDQKFSVQTPAVNRALLAPESGPLQREEFAIIWDVIRTLQHQQQAIATQIEILQQQHRQLADAAKNFQELQGCHENSARLILNTASNSRRLSVETLGSANAGAPGTSITPAPPDVLQIRASTPFETSRSPRDVQEITDESAAVDPAFEKSASRLRFRKLGKALNLKNVDRSAHRVLPEEMEYSLVDQRPTKRRRVIPYPNGDLLRTANVHKEKEAMGLPGMSKSVEIRAGQDPVEVSSESNSEEEVLIRGPAEKDKCEVSKVLVADMGGTGSSPPLSLRSTLSSRALSYFLTQSA